MSGQMNLRIDEELKNQFQQLARQEGKSASEKMRELMSDYIKQRDIRSYVDDLWDRMSENFEDREITRDDIDEAIEQVRASQ